MLLQPNMLQAYLECVQMIKIPFIYYFFYNIEFYSLNEFIMKFTFETYLTWLII